MANITFVGPIKEYYKQSKSRKSKTVMFKGDMSLYIEVSVKAWSHIELNVVRSLRYFTPYFTIWSLYFLARELCEFILR